MEKYFCFFFNNSAFFSLKRGICEISMHLQPFMASATTTCITAQSVFKLYTIKVVAKGKAFKIIDLQLPDIKLVHNWQYDQPLSCHCIYPRGRSLS